MSKIVDNRAAVHEMNGLVQTVADRVERIGVTSQAHFENISIKNDVMSSSIMSLRSLGEQVLAFVKSFPQEIRELLQSIVQADWRTYQAVQQVQAQLVHAPTCYHESNIRFTDALGDYRELPFEFFSHWEPFEGFLRSQFKNKPGEGKVLDGLFHMIDVSHGRAIIKKEHWNRSVSQGAVLTMSMIMAHIRGTYGHCPRPGCAGTAIKECCYNPNHLTCGTCCLQFFPSLDELNKSLSHINDSESEIARLQAEEDLKLYGGRPEPPELVGIDEDEELAKLPPKLSAVEFNAAINQSTNGINKGKHKEFNYRTVTAVDSNGDASSPLESWLKQSAIPSTAAVTGLHTPDLEQDAVTHEEEEIKVFRKVHIGMSHKSRTLEPGLSEEMANEFQELGLRRYYLLNVHRYPYLPQYLPFPSCISKQTEAQILRLFPGRDNKTELFHDQDREEPAHRVKQFWEDLLSGGKAF